ncbi:uncharacterized protein LOC106880339 isoform X3 [Octopus bimaculoides]|uniref:uncharacterized protein LOC106880339 isoform X3 n=1 Tax=Octopus bimaculoides TaxID=37653 RepID=UPI0022E383D7|nr:uncharacterized protein LOC106880339 isoform X3 [Octopus bimaculoides]
MHSEGKDNLEKTSLKDAVSIEEGDSEVKPEKTFRQKLSEILQSNKVQYTIIFFVVIDGLIVILELLIDLDIIKLSDKPPGYVESHEVESHGSPHDSQDSTTLHSILSNEDDYNEDHQVVYHRGHHNAALVKKHGRHHNYHDEHSMVTQAITTLSQILLNSTSDYEEEDNHSISHGHGEDHGHGGGHHGHSDKEIAEHTLHYASLAILCIFLVEVICKVIAEGTHLLKHKAEVLDAIVVVVSFTLDIVFSFVDVAQAAKDAAGLMVMLRLWRITRIINGVIISVQMEAEKKIHKVEKLLHAAENENEYLREEITKLKEELESVRKKQKKDDGKSIESVSQKTDDDLMATTLSSPTTQTSLKEHKSTTSNTQNSSKSMFVVFDDLNKSETDSNTGTSRTNECLGPRPPVFIVPTQIIEHGSPKHSCSNSGSQLGDHSQQKLNFKPSLHAPIPNTTEEVLAVPFNSLPESTSRKQTPLSPVQNNSPLDISGSKSPPNVPRQQTLEKPSSKTSSVDPSSIDQHRKQSISSTMVTEPECKDGNLDKPENLQNEIPPAIKTSRRSPTDKDEIIEPKSPYQMNSGYVESQNRPAAIILPPINVNSRKKSGQTSNYIALKSPRQRSPVGSENAFSGVDNTERRKSFIEDKMFDSPTQKDPGAPR